MLLWEGRLLTISITGYNVPVTVEEVSQEWLRVQCTATVEGVTGELLSCYSALPASTARCIYAYSYAYSQNNTRNSFTK